MLTINTDSASIALRLLSDASRRENGTLPVTAKGDGNLRGVMTTRPPTPSGNVKIMISLATAEQVWGPESFLAKTARGSGSDQIGISTSTIPQQKDAFRSEVLAFLADDMKDDKEFMVALEAGSVVVHTIDEVPELNFQPVISFALYRGGHANGGGLFTPAGFNHDLYEQLAETRGQSTGSLGNAQFYACWPGS